MRDVILAEIKRLGNQDGKAPGQTRFASETGIKRHQWLGKYWPKWGDALLEAGFQPNVLRERTDLNLVMPSIAGIVLRLGRFPTQAEMQIAWQGKEDVPQIKSVFARLRSKKRLVGEFRKWAENSENAERLLELVPEIVDAEEADSQKNVKRIGHVYLLKWGNNYKIGESGNWESRITKIGIKLPEKSELIHKIETDDPPGIEAYWHRRFADKKVNGEWFKLSSDDVRDFKKRFRQ
jgi:hypothetical protein